MAIITLTSDWGIRSHFASSVKGAILKNIPNALIVDITHSISPFNLMEASFTIKNAAVNFPAGTIHLIGINTEASLEHPHVAVLANGQYYIGADNGIFSLLFDNVKDIEAVEIEILQDSEYFTFSTRDVFVTAAKMIIEGKKLKEIGNPRLELTQRLPFNPVVYPDKIVGKVIYIDDYENVYINIDESTFKKVGKNRPFMLSFRTYDSEISRISKAYSDVIPGEKLALFGSTGYLEIAINQGKGSSLLGLSQNDSVTIEFVNK
jgi:S-adenosyl-L-methionine hydrolase (adenosine-forming)